jgi:hypothetical protein
VSLSNLVWGFIVRSGAQIPPKGPSPTLYPEVIFINTLQKTELMQNPIKGSSSTLYPEKGIFLNTFKGFIREN